MKDANLPNINTIVDVIKKIQSNCKTLDVLLSSIEMEYIKEKELIEQQSNKIIDDMDNKYALFKTSTFGKVKNEIERIIELLRKDYDNEWSNISNLSLDFSNASYNEIEKGLSNYIEKINKCVEKLNHINFDSLVLPIYIEVQKETFISFNEGHNNIKQFDCTTQTQDTINDPKPLTKFVGELFLYCKKAICCIDKLIEMYDQYFDIGEFKNQVKRKGDIWISEVEAKLRAKFNNSFAELFIDEDAQAISKSFFANLQEMGRKTKSDLSIIRNEYLDLIKIGDVKFLVDDETKHQRYLKESPAISHFLDNGSIISPVILKLKECGNILLNIDEDDYSEETVDFVNQLIIQFLLSFPVNRINFCLIDLDNKMGFSQFKILTKINNNILFDGIIRDDRQFENTIKDMEQAMYKIDDDILSYNNVQDIYEYNQRFEANPQSIHLFVLVNYPAGMRDDTAKRVLKIVQNGNKSGIFSIIINNESCSFSSGYNYDERIQFIESVEKNALVINKEEDSFSLDCEIPNQFVPEKGILVSSLPRIVEMLQDSSENNKQKVVPLSQMFSEIDAITNSRKGIGSSAEVLDIPIGARGGEIQNLLLKTTGDGSAHAVLIGGTGSGKSNLLHTIIMSACYKYSPEELNLYLVDFKGGVEFKYYEANKIREKQLPHIKLTGLTSDVEDGVAILSNLHKELRRREEDFNRNNVEDIVAYRSLGKQIPRLLVIVDEIQELFEQDERLGQKAIDILRELFKKGRAFGINILWASQNVPNAPGLKKQVLSQIGNRISLRLNDPEDAAAISIDPKAVKNLNRPEKGLGVINDIRYGNESIEFRVAYAEKSENRQRYSQQIIDKWKSLSNRSLLEPLFIVGDTDEASPIIGHTIYNVVPTIDQIVSKSFDSYNLQIGQDYVTGKPYDVNITLREDKMNLLFAGYDVEILRDMMGYSLLSIIMNHITNADCIAEKSKIYYVNGEMINPKNSDDLFNVLRLDFSHIIDNVTSTDRLVSCIKDIYKVYKERCIEADSFDYAKVYAPIFLVIHSMQRYADLFNENPMLKFTNESTSIQNDSNSDSSLSKLDRAMSLFSSVKTIMPSTSPSSNKTNMPDCVFFSDAVKDLIDKGGKYGIHFIISMDNPFGIPAIKNNISEIMYKVFIKGINANVVSQILGDYKVTNSLNNPKIALVAMQDERTKVKVYRYDPNQDEIWYKTLCANYKKLRGCED